MSAAGGGAAGIRLGRDHFAYLRAIAQGMAVEDAARRWLGLEHAAAALGLHRAVVDQAQTVARRRGDPRWRLLGIELGTVEPPDERPSIDDWAEAEGLDGWSMAELEDMYLERFGAEDPSWRRRAARNARLSERRLQLLLELEALAAERAAPTDLLDGWLDPEVAAQLRQRGVLMLGELQAMISRGGRWWLGLRAFGPVKAARLAAQVKALLGEPVHAWPVARASVDVVKLDGSQGRNRESRALCGVSASNDREAIRSWIAARAGSPLTAKQYEREAERFLLWCVLERGKALSDAVAEDCRGYMDFIAAVPDSWISRKKVERFGVGWAPFKGQLSIASQGLALAALHSLFAWLVQARYLASNPWVLVNRRLGDDPRHAGDDPSSRAFTPTAWKAMREHLATAPQTASTQRLIWLCVFTESTGLRAAELLRAERGHLQKLAAGWVLRVHGKGRRNRTVPVPKGALEATRAYFAGQGLDFDIAPADTPLLGSLSRAGEGIGYSALHETFTRLVKRSMAGLEHGDRENALRATAHWLRHTHATRAAERNVPLDVLQENLGQSDPRTTARYYRAQMTRRQEEIERAFSTA